MVKKAPRSPAYEWAWWKIAGLAFFALGGLSLMLAVFPHLSSQAAALALILFILGFVGSLWSWRTYNWWARLIVTNSFLLLLLGIGIRAWSEIVPAIWILAIGSSIAYVLAWALPVLSPKLSAAMVREQTNPQTALGRGCFIVGVVVAPAAAGLGATFGLYGSRYGQGDLVFLLIGISLIFASLILGHSASYNHWMERPWVGQAKPS